MIGELTRNAQAIALLTPLNGYDVNGSYNIMRKVIPTVFDGGIEGVVVRPIRITPNKAKNKSCHI
jgi:hypothetical protein